MGGSLASTTLHPTGKKKNFGQKLFDLGNLVEGVWGETSMRCHTQKIGRGEGVLTSKLGNFMNG